MWSSETFSSDLIERAQHRSKISEQNTPASILCIRVRVCFVVLLREGNRFFFVAYFFVIFFSFLVLKFSLTFPSFCRSSLFSNRRLLYHHRKRKDTSAPREREIKRERFEREFFDSRSETRLVNARAQNVNNTTFRSSSNPETRKNR